ncbi:tetratricopeptide repeat protein [Pseudoalteromonas sp. BZB3]|uniref:tetratricopeptide repeat protein n=1 Tax=Pseudoalteromonas sp. BZB3 TaxID=3136670 RepID=UPI0032C44E75
MKKLKQIIIAALLSQSLCSTVAFASSSYAQFKIEVAPPTFVLPQFTGPYTEKEANIAPEELETAERLKSLLEQGKREQVLKELEAFYEIELSVAMIMLKAQLYFALEDYDKAEKAYLSSLSRSPQLIRAHSDLGQLYLLKGELEKAREHFSNAISYGSQDALIYGQLAYLNLSLYGPYSAISAYQQALTLEPTQEQWQQGLFIALTQAKMYPAAQALLSELIAKHPNDHKLWLNQAILKLELNNNVEALASLEMAILLGNEQQSNYKIAAQLHMQLDSFDRAVELISFHLNNFDLEMNSLNTYLTWLGQRGLWSQSQKILSSLESKLPAMSAPKQSIIYLHHALIAKQLNKKIQTVESFQLAIEKNPNNGKALLEYANYLTSDKQFTKAETLLLRAEALNESKKEAMLARAQLYVDLQNYQAALKTLKSVANRYTETKGIWQQIALIENIIQTRKQQEI